MLIVNEARLEELENRLGYRFSNRELLLRALTHTSWSRDHPGEGFHNQRLEFLGDAILGALLADWLFALLPDQREGRLTRSRSVLARGATLADLARRFDLSEFLRMGVSERNAGAALRDSILEDALEAIAGAIYLDAGWDQVREVVRNWYGDVGELLERVLDEHNPKGRLQELVQPRLGNDAIRYRLIDDEGPDHAKTFVAAVEIAGQVVGTGSGNSKKEAEESAAHDALKDVGPLLGNPETP